MSKHVLWTKPTLHASVADINKKLKKELYDIIASHSGQTSKKVWNDSDRDYWMIAAEAKAYGMIDEVLERK